THFLVNVNYRNVTDERFYIYLQFGSILKEVVPVVADNLTTDDPKKALSAAQGVKIGDIINISLSNLNLGADSYAWIYPDNSTNVARRNKFYNGLTYRHFHPNVSSYVGETIKITADNDRLTRYFFLTDIVLPTDSNPLVEPNWCEGYNKVITINAGMSVYVTVPDDAMYLYLETDSEAKAVPTVEEMGTIKQSLDECLQVINGISADTVFVKTSNITIGQSDNRYIGRMTNSTASNRNVWIESVKFKSVLIPIGENRDIRGGQQFVLVPTTDTRGSCYAFLTAAPDFTSSSRPKPQYAEGYKEPKVTKKEVLLKAPEDARYLYIETMYNNYNTSPSSLRNMETIQEALDNIDIHSGTGILDFNPDSEFLPKFEALKKRVRVSSTATPESVVFAHISDCHGGANNTSTLTWNRFIDFVNHWSGYIDDAVDTGDVVSAQYSDPIAWRTNSDNVLTIIGNHDTRYGTSGSDWQTYVGADAYDKFIAPNIENWGVTQPSDSDTLGKCYYHKDYTDNNSGKTLRAIF
ncbi:MAG: metallophosphoesterase, partial [Lachnospiraceae bacterium]|nr:metallophosphoesterase [Lachnospiraceae bacterium]